MGLFDRFRTAREPIQQEKFEPSRQQKNHHQRFLAAQNSNLLYGWDTQPRHIDEYLRRDLRVMRARAREQARNNDYVRRFMSMCENNVVGHTGISVHSMVRQLRDSRKLDQAANEALDSYWNDYQEGYCDVGGCMNFVDIERLFVRSMSYEGEFIYVEHEGPKGYFIELIDPEQLDTDLNRPNGANVIRLGIEYNPRGVAVRYYFNRVNHYGEYVRGNHRVLPASIVKHRFIVEWIHQNRGIPWINTALYRLKMLAGYEDAAITAARAGAETVGYYTTKTGDEEFGVTDEDIEIEDTEPGSKIKLPPGVDFKAHDPTYPHEQFDDFMKRALRGIGSGLGAQYESLSNDREGVNYSSIRQGELEARETWKLMQKFVIDGLVRPVRERVIYLGLLRGDIKIGRTPLSRGFEEYRPAYYQGRRWDWVDPLKEHTANEKALAARTTSISQIIRDSGRDPDDVFNEISAERKKLEALDILPSEKSNTVTEVVSDDDEEGDKKTNS
ncbi:MAG: phage portal protein [Pseudomonadota bacterium]